MILPCGTPEVSLLNRRQNEWQKYRSQIPLATCEIVQFRTAVLPKATTNPPFRRYF
jgi:hypothetical protein